LPARIVLSLRSRPHPPRRPKDLGGPPEEQKRIDKRKLGVAHDACRRRHSSGESPTHFLKARLKAASDSKPTAVCDKQGKVSIRLVGRNHCHCRQALARRRSTRQLGWMPIGCVRPWGPPHDKMISHRKITDNGALLPVARAKPSHSQFVPSLDVARRGLGRQKLAPERAMSSGELPPRTNAVEVPGIVSASAGMLLSSADRVALLPIPSVTLLGRSISSAMA
jgi:hypothetical protein